MYVLYVAHNTFSLYFTNFSLHKDKWIFSSCVNSSTTGTKQILVVLSAYHCVQGAFYFTKNSHLYQVVLKYD